RASPASENRRSRALGGTHHFVPPERAPAGASCQREAPMASQSSTDCSEPDQMGVSGEVPTQDIRQKARYPRWRRLRAGPAGRLDQDLVGVAPQPVLARLHRAGDLVGGGLLAGVAAGVPVL